MVRVALTLWISILRSCAAVFRSREDQVISAVGIPDRQGKYREFADLGREARGETARFQPLHGPFRAISLKRETGNFQPLSREPQRPRGRSLAVGKSSV